jgi:hypothetical protein
VYIVLHCDLVRVNALKINVLATLIVVAIPTVPVVTSGAFPMPVSPEDVRVESIYFYNGLLRANISWRFEEGKCDICEH